MPGREIATRRLVLQALEDGKKVFVPYIYKSPDTQFREMDMLQLHSAEDLDSLKPDAWGIPTLGVDSVAQRQNALGGAGIGQSDSGPPILDLIFMPALAFDQEFMRLGHGKGYYDRYLARYKSRVSSTGGGGKMPILSMQSSRCWS
jgi:5-formyltetrahydrofolate cyclo-ligase